MEQINITQLDPDEFFEKFKVHLQEVLQKVSEKDSKELLTRQEVSEYLSINLSTLWSYTRSGKLKAYSIGNRVYYKKSEIDQALIKIN